MAEEPGQKSWWTTLPGVFTGLAALITAITGLVLAFRPADKAAPPRTPSSSAVAEAVRTGQVAPEPAATPAHAAPGTKNSGNGGSSGSGNALPEKTADASAQSAVPATLVQVNQDRWSTDIDKPTPLWTRDLQGGSPGGEREYFFALQTSGPGEVILTLDVTGRSTAATVVWQVTDREANKIANGYVSTPYQKRLERKVERFDTGRSLPLVLRLSVDGEVQTFRVKLDGPVALP